MRLFLFISITLISLSLNAQNCKKLIISSPVEYHDFTFDDLSSSMISSTLGSTKRLYIQKLLKRIYNEQNNSFIIYLKENNNVYTAKGKRANSESVVEIKKVEKIKNNIYFIYFDDENPTIMLNLNNNTCFDFKNGKSFNIEQSLCEF